MGKYMNRLCLIEEAISQQCVRHSQDQVERKVLLTKASLEEAVDHIRGAVMIAFPQGLPEWDLVRQAIEGTEELAGTSVCPLPHSLARTSVR